MTFIYFSFIWVKSFYIDNIIRKVICSFFKFITLTLLLIFYLNYSYILPLILCRKMVINVFVLLNILSDNSIYQQLQ